MDLQTLSNLGLVLLFVIIGGVFAATELALVSLRDSQLTQIAKSGPRGARTAAVARDPNRFLAAVQIGVTVAGFLSAAYGGATLAPDLAPYLEDLGLPEAAADTAALVALTLLIAYLSLVLGELAPKRLALQRSARIAVLVAPPLDRFATLMRPVIWLLSKSSDLVVRLLGGDPHAINDEVSGEELRDIVTTHRGLGAHERQIMSDVFSATDSTVKEVMQPRGDVVWLDASTPLPQAAHEAQRHPFSRYPLIEGSFDTVVGYVHVRDLLNIADDDPRRASDIKREVVLLPATNRVLDSISQLRNERTHLAVVVDEYGGTDGIVTLEDLIEELIGEITDEYDDPTPPSSPSTGLLSAGLSIQDFARRTGIELTDGDFETVAGYVMAELGRIPEVGDWVEVGGRRLSVTQMRERRVVSVALSAAPAPPAGPADGPPDGPPPSTSAPTG